MTSWKGTLRPSGRTAAPPLADPLRQAHAAFMAGDDRTAIAHGEAAVRAQPDNAAAHQLLGVAASRSGDPARGAEHLRRAIALGADTPDLRINLARALLDLGDLHAAERMCAEARTGSADLQRMRADILKAQGRLTEAAALYEALVRAGPRDAEALNNLGNVRHELGEVDAAMAALERAHAIRADLPAIAINLGRAYETAGRFDNALTAYRAAVKVAPEDAQALFGLGKTLLRLGRAADALPVLGSAARIDRNNPALFVVIGLTFAAADDLAQAERAYRIAIHVAPKHGPAYLNLAILLERGNRTDELAALRDRARENGVDVAELDHVEAMVLRREGQLADALALAERSRPASLDPALRAQFIGQVADRLDQVATAFAAFTEMNRVTAAYPDAARFDGTERARHVEALLARTTAAHVARWRPVEVPATPPAPAFLIGFLRSGTTLLDTILMGHPGTHVLEELPLLARVEEAGGDLDRLGSYDDAGVRMLRTRYFDELARAAPAPAGALVIDKNPLGGLRAPLIHRMFPDAPIIFALRHPCDVVLSCWMQNFTVNEAMASFLDLENAARLYDRVMTYWNRCREVLPLNVHQVRYEDLVQDVEGEMRPLLDFLGLPWDAQVLDHRRTAGERGYIRTPSYAQVTEQVHTRASGRWVRYREHLNPILPILAPWAERFGYSMD